MKRPNIKVDSEEPVQLQGSVPSVSEDAEVKKLTLDQEFVTNTATDIPKYWKPEDANAMASLEAMEENTPEPLPENELYVLHDPSIKKVYGYDDDGLYTHPVIAYECPIEKGVFHIPANATETMPPVTKNGERAIFAAGQWRIVRA